MKTLKEVSEYCDKLMDNPWNDSEAIASMKWYLEMLIREYTYKKGNSIVVEMSVERYKAFEEFEQFEKFKKDNTN